MAAIETAGVHSKAQGMMVDVGKQSMATAAGTQTTPISISLLAHDAHACPDVNGIACANKHVGLLLMNCARLLAEPLSHALPYFSSLWVNDEPQ